MIFTLTADILGVNLIFLLPEEEAKFYYLFLLSNFPLFAADGR